MMRAWIQAAKKVMSPKNQIYIILFFPSSPFFPPLPLLFQLLASGVAEDAGVQR